jgi:beta-glucosidase
VIHARGCGLLEADRSGIAEAVEAARGAEAAILFLGESSQSSHSVDWAAAEGRHALCGEGFDRDEIGLPGVQQELKDVSFTLGPAELALVDADMKETVEPGEFEVTVGGLKGTFTAA